MTSGHFEEIVGDLFCERAKSNKLEPADSLELKYERHRWLARVADLCVRRQGV